MNNYKFILSVSLVTVLFGITLFLIQDTCTVPVDQSEPITDVIVSDLPIVNDNVVVNNDLLISQTSLPEKQVFEFDSIFNFRKSTISENGKLLLDNIIQKIDENSTVIVVGHTDYLGSKQFNKKLSKKRADAVVDYLKNKVNANFKSIGVGSLIPSGKTDHCKSIKNKPTLIQCLSPDRRVEIEFVKSNIL